MEIAPDNERVEAFFNAAHSTFVNAARNTGGTVDYDFFIGGQHVRFCCAGERWAEKLLPALEHLRCDSEDKADISVDLTVCLWDDRSTGTTMPDTPWSTEDHIERGEIRGFNTTRFCTGFNPRAAMLTMLDLDSDLALCWMRNLDELPSFEQATPITAIFHWFLRSKSMHLVHAAAVGVPGCGLLLAGRGGAGKSSTALSCLQAGMLYLSDDFCAVSHHPTPTVHSLYSSGRLHPDGLARLPQLDPWIENRTELDHEKGLFFVNRRAPEQVRPELPLRAILVPTIVSRPDSSIETTPPGVGFRALLATTIRSFAGIDDSGIAYIAELTRRVPSFNLYAGSDPRYLTECVEEFARRRP
ncbi:MAG: hypothetical protein ACJA09_002021 [Alcanivorax sp.]|jgi:hypothetical protein